MLEVEHDGPVLVFMDRVGVTNVSRGFDGPAIFEGFERGLPPGTQV